MEVCMEPLLGARRCNIVDESDIPHSLVPYALSNIPNPQTYPFRSPHVLAHLPTSAMLLTCPRKRAMPTKPEDSAKIGAVELMR